MIGHKKELLYEVQRAAILKHVIVSTFHIDARSLYRNFKLFVNREHEHGKNNLLCSCNRSSKGSRPQAALLQSEISIFRTLLRESED